VVPGRRRPHLRETPGYACLSKNGWHMYVSFRLYHLRSTLAANINPAGTQGMSGALCA